ncbi:MAG: RNA polymerase sigma factor [Fibrobacter sp.]|nr:RNA polymerase sigma factor [Fibrobacter sp.]MBR7056810.1 RNA polymerase sigma factor [Oscillospiraceae bacterium]
MEDAQIIELYWLRSEQAISETAIKYGKLCKAISYNILHNCEDAEECVNDTYLKTWESIPPQRPRILSAFVAKITRNLSLHQYKHQHAQKRGGGQIAMVLSEMEDCIPTNCSMDDALERIAIADALNSFFENLPLEIRNIFIQRYWFLFSISELALEHRTTESKIKSILFRCRKKLAEVLKEAGVSV